MESKQLTPAPGTQVCPKCGAFIPVTPGYPVWCDQCNWNIDPRIIPPQKKALDKAIEFIARRSERSLFERLKKERLKKTDVTFAKMLLYFTAALIHILNLVLAAFVVFIGVYLILFTMGGVVQLIVVILVGLLLVLLVRPRFPRMKLRRADRNEFPGLYALSDKVAAALGTKPVDLVFTADFNAFFMKTVLKAPVVGIGVPLFALLEADEKVAIVSHEISHGINGDAARSFFVRSAKAIITRYFGLFYVNAFSAGIDTIGPLAFLWNGLRWIISQPILLVWFAVHLFAIRDSQRAEYYADLLGSRVAGTQASVRALKKLYLGYDYYYLLGVTGNWGRALVRFLARAEMMPERERERLRRLSDSAATRIDVTHPSDCYRIAFLEANPQTIGLALKKEEIDLIDAEIARLRPVS